MLVVATAGAVVVMIDLPRDGSSIGVSVRSRQELMRNEDGVSLQEQQSFEAFIYGNISERLQ
jgi:hypothetical protein